MFLDYLANKFSVYFTPSRNDYYIAEHKIGENYFALIKPSQYVNNSGLSVSQALSEYSVSIDDLLVVYDDVYLSTGTFRLKLTGGDGGHKGINSINYHLSSENIIRIRIGVGNMDFTHDNISEFVLSDFSKKDEKLLQKVFEDCVTLVDGFITGGKKQLLDLNSKLVKPDNNPAI